MVAASPVVGIERLVDEVKRDRVLSPAELRDVWQAAEAGKGTGAIAVQLLALTGQRRDEVGGLAWNELDLPNAT